MLKDLKAIVGVRAENYVQHYTGQDQQGENILDNEKVLDNLNFFPSVNLIYNLKEKQNIRLSYSKTIARPSLKELSYAQIFDPISGITFIGGLSDDTGIDNDGNEVVYWDGNLVSTNIHNLDLRWEFFQTNGHMLSVSGFYKKFSNPIEMVQFATTQKIQIQPRNVGDGQLLGAELELRQSFDILSENLSNFSIASNFTYVQSRVKLSESEYDSRALSARTGQTIDKYRDMAGQSPYLLNLGVTYDGGTNGIWEGLEGGLYYNVQGRTLQVVGIKDRPDIYTEPFHSLNLNVTKQFKKGFGIGFKVKNILNSKVQTVYKSYEAGDQYYEFRETGTSYSLSLSYKF